jgi:hypothetical protein
MMTGMRLIYSRGKMSVLCTDVFLAKDTRQLPCGTAVCLLVSSPNLIRFVTLKSDLF